MALFSFSHMKDKILDGSKTGTCRIINHQKVHDMRARAKVWSLWWKSRTPGREFLFDVRPEKAQRFQFVFTGWKVGDQFRIYLLRDDAPCTGRVATTDETNEIVWRDGFGTLNELVGVLVEIHGENTFKKPFGNYLWIAPK